MTHMNDEILNVFEWYAQGLTSRSPNYKKGDITPKQTQMLYQERLGVFSKIDDNFIKAVATLMVYRNISKEEYQQVRMYLAQILIQKAKQDKKRMPDFITIEQLAWLMARLVIDFMLDPQLNDFYTAQGRLFYAGIHSFKINVNAYRMTWKKYEQLMQETLEQAVFDAHLVLNDYKVALGKH